MRGMRFSNAKRKASAPADRPRLRQVLRLQDPVELQLRQQLLLEYEVVDAASRCMRDLRDHARVLIADVRVERGDDADRVPDRRLQMFPVRRNPAHALVGEGEARLSEMQQALEQAVRDDRLERIELEL